MLEVEGDAEAHGWEQVCARLGAGSKLGSPGGFCLLRSGLLGRSQESVVPIVPRSECGVRFSAGHRCGR